MGFGLSGPVLAAARPPAPPTAVARCCTAVGSAQTSLESFGLRRLWSFAFFRYWPARVASRTCLNAMPTRLSSEQRRFACQHLGLAHQQAHRYARRWGMPIEELLSPAYEGLCKGAAQFDAAKGYRPSSYLVSKVKGELLHHLRDTGFAVRISHRYRELWVKARRWLELDLSDAEIAIRLGVPLALWLDCRQACGLRPGTLEGL